MLRATAKRHPLLNWDNRRSDGCPYAVETTTSRSVFADLSAAILEAFEEVDQVLSFLLGQRITEGVSRVEHTGVEFWF